MIVYFSDPANPLKMSLQITTGSLIALGVGAGDIAGIVGLGRRFGNWCSAASEDNEFLSMLDEDEFEVLQRRGLVDLPSFNKRWRKEMRLFVNGKPSVFKDKDADKVLEQIPRFTAVMVCVVTALDTFTTSAVTRKILRNVLKELLRPSERGEDLLATQYPTRLNSWRSLSCLRGFMVGAAEVHRTLVGKGVILKGLMPQAEGPLVEEFLLWLLAGQTDTYTTPSSDIAGIALCLSQLGIDVLSIDGLGLQPQDTSCRLIYTTDSSILARQNALVIPLYPGDHRRELQMIVPLLHPEECVVQFPVSLDVHNRCRQAWIAGQRAARHVALGILVPIVEPEYTFMPNPHDIRYSFIDRGTPPQRVSTQIQELASMLAFVINQELLIELQNCLHHEPSKVLDWLKDQISGQSFPHLGHLSIESDKLQDLSKIHAFCVYQSFFMGYCYNVFMEVIDTKSLKMQTIEGHWGFRSADFFRYIHSHFWKAGGKAPLGSSAANAITISRQSILEALALLFLNYPLYLKGSDPHHEELRRDEHQFVARYCVGVIAKKTILVNSLVNPCYSPRDIGRFVLLDVDVGGIPRDHDGLIRPGIQVDPITVQVKEPSNAAAVCKITESAPAEDASLHIEADWDGDPDRMMLCARYKGRRFMTLSPSLTDMKFCIAYVPPVEKPDGQPLESAIAYTASDLIERRPVYKPSGDDATVLVQVLGRPRLRYIAVSSFIEFSMPQIASNCIHRAASKRDEMGNRIGSLVIAGQGKEHPLVSPEISNETGDLYALA